MSRSVTSAAVTIAKQTSPAERSTGGSRTQVVGPPVTTLFDGSNVPDIEQETCSHVPLTATGSLNVTVTLVLAAAVAPLAGIVETT